jgi:phosphate transport system substrate-binding protein
MTKFNKIVGLALILGLLHACGSKPNPEKEEAYQKAAEKFVADESFFPILDEELFYFNSQRVDTIGVEYMNE